MNAACPNAEPAAEKRPQCISGECVSSGPLAAPSARLTRDLWNNFWSHTLNNTLSAGKGKILWSSQFWVRPPLCEMNVIEASFFSVGFTWGSASILYVRAEWQKEASSSQLYSPGIQPLHIGVGGDDKYWHFASSGDIESALAEGGWQWVAPWPWPPRAWVKFLPVWVVCGRKTGSWLKCQRILFPYWVSADFFECVFFICCISLEWLTLFFF